MRAIWVSIVSGTGGNSPSMRSARRSASEKVLPRFRWGLCSRSAPVAAGWLESDMIVSFCCQGCSMRLWFGDDGSCSGGPTAAQPMAEVVHVDVDHRCSEQIQYLGYQQATDDRIAEGLTDFRPDAGADHQWDPSEQSTHRGHQNRTKAQTTGFVDRLLGAEAALALTRQSKVDQHDADLLDDAYQQNDPEDSDHVERHAEQHQGQQGAEPRRGQGGDDRDRVDRALVEHAEDDVDRDQGRQDQDWRATERALKRLRTALKTGGNRARQVELLRGLLDRGDRLADRNFHGKVEAQRYRRELALVVDRNRRGCRGDRGEFAQRYFGAAGRGRIDAAKRIQPKLKIGLDFENHEILIQP